MLPLALILLLNKGPAWSSPIAEEFEIEEAVEEDRIPRTAATRQLLRAMNGTASLHGAGFYCRQTASGERLRKGTLTAAHRTLSFGTRVRITNHDNGLSVVVHRNDRGPFL